MDATRNEHCRRLCPARYTRRRFNGGSRCSGTTLKIQFLDLILHIFIVEFQFYEILWPRWPALFFGFSSGFGLTRTRLSESSATGATVFSESDLPVSRDFTFALQNLDQAIKIRTKSKWLNAVSIQVPGCAEDLIHKISQVREVFCGVDEWN
jgi:hypothetical protein